MKVDFSKNHWTCSNCNSYNDILRQHCWNCYFYRTKNLEKLALRTIYDRSGLKYDSQGLHMAESDKIELHTKFFNAEKILYSAMTMEQRLEHRAEMASLIFEARARMNAIDDVDRESKAKLSPDGKQWILSNNETVNVSGAISEPKIRKERMSKADKLKESLGSLGLDMSTVNALMGKVAEAQSGGSQTSSTTRELKDRNNIVFVKENPTNNTQSSLLADISNNIIIGINDRPIDDLYEAAKTAGHIGNKLLGPVQETELETIENVAPIESVSSMFGFLK